MSALNSLERQHAQEEAPRPNWWRGLSGKLLALTVLFVMIGEVLIFVSSIANFRITWLKERVATAEIAAFAAEAAPVARPHRHDCSSIRSPASPRILGVGIPALPQQTRSAKRPRPQRCHRLARADDKAKDRPRPNF